MPRPDSQPPFALAIHGGAGTILPAKMTATKEAAFREALAESLAAGYAILENNGSSLDAVQASIKVMEDSPLFNAGKGAVFTNEGTNEQDACIMNGIDRNAGAVAAVTHVRNPINLARKVLDHSSHVLLGGEGAERFAALHGVELVGKEYFYTKERWYQLQLVKQREEAQGDQQMQMDHSDDQADKIGTVGAVALDREGNLAAATSTGGMTNKRFGRIGDSPIIGAGTWADNATCAVSATGVGEFIMRIVLAYDIAALMTYKEMDLISAADEVVLRKLSKIGGSGGVIAIDRKGTITMPFNSPGMYRGYRYPDQEAVVKIFKETT